MEKRISSDRKDGVTAEASQKFGHLAPDSQATPPPPTYTETRNHVPVDEKGPSPSYETPESSTYPPLPHHTQSPSLTLEVRYENWLGNDVRILNAGNAEELYTMKLQLRKPNMTINSASTKATIGTVTFHSLTSRIDTTVHNTPISMTSRGLLKNRHTYSSPALGNVEVTWKYKGFSSDLVCLDGRGITLARFSFANWGLHKCGKFEMFGPEVTQGAVLEEILVTGLAMVEYSLALTNLTAISAG